MSFMQKLKTDASGRVMAETGLMVAIALTIAMVALTAFGGGPATAMAAELPSQSAGI